MSASSDGLSIKTGTKLEPILPRSAHAQIAYDECLKQQVALLVADRDREAAEKAARGVGGDADQQLADGGKATPSSSTTSCEDKSDAKSKRKSGKKKSRLKSQDGQKSRRRSARKRRRHNILVVNTSKSKASSEVLRISLNELGWRWKEVWLCNPQTNHLSSAHEN